MFKRFTLIVFILALIPVLASTAAPKSGGKEIILKRLLEAAGQFNHAVFSQYPAHKAEAIIDAKRRARAAWQDYIESYGEEEIDQSIEQILEAGEIKLCMNPEVYRSRILLMQMMILLRTFLENSANKAQDNINKGVPSPRAKTQSPRSSKPAPKPLTIVPNVLGRRLEQAKEILERAGLKVGQIDYVYDQEKLWDIILRQNPRPGKEVPSFTPVDLTINTDSEDLIPDE